MRKFAKVGIEVSWGRSNKLMRKASPRIVR